MQKVLWTLAELGLDYAYEDRCRDFPRPRDSRYAALKGRPVPILEDDDGVMWEGNAIARYLASRYGDVTLYPAEPCGRADIERWMDYQLSTVRVHLHPLLRGTLSADEVAERARLLGVVMEPLDATLAEQSYLAGDRFTLADIPLGIAAFRVIDVPRPPMPQIEAWYQRISARPAFRSAIKPPVDTNIAVRSSAV